MCSACRGSGKETIHGQAQTCERCKGRGKAYFDPARSREYREWFRLARELVLSVQGGGPSSLETGELSYAEVQRLNREMAERAGILSLAELEARADQLHRK